MEVTLQQILDAREQRAAQQQALLRQFQKPLICFTMNIAGPIKNSCLIEAGFYLGNNLLKAQLAGSKVNILHFWQNISSTGCEGFYVADAEPMTLKRLCVEVEDALPLGRLYDMDVICPSGSKISRESLGLPGRKCLICGAPGHLCSRSRAHSVAQLQEKTTALLQEAIFTQRSQQVGSAAVQSLLYEVCTTPKPGLVDCRSSGSHQDMDLFTFLASSAALQPYFAACVHIGLETADLPPTETFSRLRLPGKLAEQTMYQATGGVNTHKGAIFSLGILCGAAGRLSPACWQPASVLAECAAMVKGITAQDFAAVTLENASTAGQRLYSAFGITGIRGQAEAGFPAVLEHGLPTLEQGLAQGRSMNEAGCAALLALMAHTEDTNLMARSDVQTQQHIAAQIAALLQVHPYPDRITLEELDAAFTAQNLSPGGSADLLAVTYFLWLLQQSN